MSMSKDLYALISEGGVKISRRSSQDASLVITGDQRVVDELRMRQGELNLYLLWQDLAHAGVELRLVEQDGATTFVARPRDKITAAMVARLKKNKAQLLANLLRYHRCRESGCDGEAYIYDVDADEQVTSLCKTHVANASD